MKEVISVTPLKNYRLLVEFDNRERRIKDITPLLDKPAFIPLKNIAFFNTVSVVYGAVTWQDDEGNEIDLCPDNTYLTSVPLEEELGAVVLSVLSKR